MPQGYAEKLRDPRWQKKRLQILERDNWACVVTGRTDETLHVHHKRYKGNPWDSPDEDLETVCESIHEAITLGAKCVRRFFPELSVSAKDLYDLQEETIVQALAECGGDGRLLDFMVERESWKLDLLYLSLIQKKYTHTQSQTQGSMTVKDVSKT